MATNSILKSVLAQEAQPHVDAIAMALFAAEAEVSVDNTRQQDDQTWDRIRARMRDLHAACLAAQDKLIELTTGGGTEIQPQEGPDEKPPK